MLTKTVIPTGDLSQILDSVWEYNRRGQVAGLMFFDASGRPLDVASIEVLADDGGLAVRSRPESSPSEEALASMYRPILDPRLVPAPQSIGELAAAGR